MRPDARLRGRLAIVAVAFAVGCSRDLTDAVQDGTDAVRAALESSANPDRLDASGEAALHVAALRGDVATIQVLLEHKASVDRLDGRGATPLTVAVEVGCTPCVHELILAGADPNIPAGAHAEPMLHRAVRAGARDLVAVLLAAGASASARNLDGETPLHAAASADAYRSVVVARLLVDHGADVHAADVLGDTPIHAAAVYNQTDLIAYYASLGVDLNATNDWGATPLDRAVERHQDRAIEALYERGAQAKTTVDFTPPLIDAARVDDIERARWLLIYGADPARSFQGKSAVQVARESGSGAVAALFAGVAARR